MGLVFEKETYAILGACFEVYKEMGCRFLEPAYQECMERELTDRQAPFRVQAELEISYKGKPLKKKYEPDFICYLGHHPKLRV